MINPIVIIVSAALLLAVLTICIINRPKKPIITGTVIVILICFVIFTFLIDGAISSLGSAEADGFVKFLTMSEEASYDALASSFHTYMLIDIGLIAASLLSLFVEILLILRKDSKKLP